MNGEPRPGIWTDGHGGYTTVMHNREMIIRSPACRFAPMHPMRKRGCVACGEPIGGGIAVICAVIYAGFSDDPDQYPSALAAPLHEECKDMDASEIAASGLNAWRYNQRAAYAQTVASLVPCEHETEVAITVNGSRYKIVRDPQ